MAIRRPQELGFGPQELHHMITVYQEACRRFGLSPDTSTDLARFILKKAADVGDDPDALAVAVARHFGKRKRAH